MRKTYIPHFSGEVCIWKNTCHALSTQCLLPDGGKENLFYSRGLFLGMGLDAMGKAQGPRRVQDAFPCTPSQLPTVVLSVMVNTQLGKDTILCPTARARAGVCDDSCEHAGLEAGMFPHLTGIGITYSCQREQTFQWGSMRQKRDDVHFSYVNSLSYTNWLSCFQQYVFPLFLLLLMPGLFPQVMAIAPTHYIWQRERSVHHSGALRNYDEGAQLPRGPSATPTDCLLCGKKGRFVRLGLSSSSSSTDTLEMIEIHSSQKSKDAFSAEKMLIDSPYKAQGMV